MPTPKELGVQVGDTIRNVATRSQEPGPIRRVESVGKTTLHTSCGVTVSLNSPGWQMVRRQPLEMLPPYKGAWPSPPRGVDTALKTDKPRKGLPRIEEWESVLLADGVALVRGHVWSQDPCEQGAPIAVHLSPPAPEVLGEGLRVNTGGRSYVLGKPKFRAMRLEQWETEEVGAGFLRISGLVWGNPEHKDGTLIHVTPEGINRGHIEEGLTIKAGGDWYKLGEALAEAREVGEALEWNDHDAGPDKVILDMLGKAFVHAETGGLYRVILAPVWDSGRNRWMIQYSRLKNIYVHLPEDFLRPGRFIEVKD